MSLVCPCKGHAVFRIRFGVYIECNKLCYSLNTVGIATWRSVYAIDVISWVYNYNNLMLWYLLYTLFRLYTEQTFSLYTEKTFSLYTE